MTEEDINELRKVVKEAILKDWMETFIRDTEIVRASLISLIDKILEEAGDIKLSDFRQLIFTLYDAIAQEMREQMLVDIEEKGLLK